MTDPDSDAARPESDSAVPAAAPQSTERPRLRVLYQIGSLLERGLKDIETLDRVMEILGANLGVTRGMVAIFEKSSGRLRVEASLGLSEAQVRHTSYNVGEGVVGRTYQTGQTVVLPSVGKDTGEGVRDASCICTPIRLGIEVIGTLSVEKPRVPLSELAQDADLLRAITFMIAHSVRLRQETSEMHDRMHEDREQRDRLAERFRHANIVGTSAAMQEVYSLIMQVAPTDTTALLRGENGTGKELVAQAIHYNSLRRDGPFVRVNCGALSESLLESELFGHVKGAFTGAVRDRVGRFEAAAGGTIFLDEIGDFSPRVQVKLLRVLQEREFERVGATRTIPLDVRIVAATHKPLESMIQEGLFREDLFYRFNVFSIHLPPLRERKSDILLLADHFCETYSKIMNKTVKRISTPAIDMLMRYHWPGNVRELQNVLERAVLLSSDGAIHGFHLPPSLQTAEATQTEMTGSLESQLDTYEREIIIEALKRLSGNVASAARELNMTYRKLAYRIQAHGINPKLYKR
ncbi:MAG: sigma 54-interacting transcriptional regulator [Deltaproteobacteria bacterium]|nr:sigma 54-interacting transcriptional regulator [Deltaproteobacteria bacterium]